MDNQRIFYEGSTLRLVDVEKPLIVGDFVLDYSFYKQ